MTYYASPLLVERFLRGVRYPAKKDQIVSYAISQNAPRDTIETLHHIDDHEYGGPVELASEIEQVQAQENRINGSDELM